LSPRSAPSFRLCGLDESVWIAAQIRYGHCDGGSDGRACSLYVAHVDGNRLEADGAARAVQIAQQVDGPVKVVWTREEDIQHDMYRPYWFDRMSAGLDEKGKPVAWNHRYAGSSVMARWAPPFFKNGLDSDTTEGAIDLTYALPNMHVEYVRAEPPGIPTAFWRSVPGRGLLAAFESILQQPSQPVRCCGPCHRREGRTDRCGTAGGPRARLRENKKEQN
jgi:hypothetical protein